MKHDQIEQNQLLNANINSLETFCFKICIKDLLSFSSV